MFLGKIGVVIPDRKDRPRFLNHCLDMLQRQTIQPDYIRVVNEESGLEKDITWRYKKGFDTIFNYYDCEICFLIENDDWYDYRYIETMLNNWEANGKPEIFGIGYTIYYHIQQAKYRRMIHEKRSSAFCTMVTKNVLSIPFPKEEEPFLDLHLWKNMDGKTFIPKQIITLGIKHGLGSCGGKAHCLDFKYDNEDFNNKYLESIIDKKSFYFYKSLTE